VFREVCTADLSAYLAAPLDPAGRFYTAGLTPTHAGWAQGDRQLRCGIGRRPMNADEFANPRDQAVAFSGSAIGQSQDRIFEVGTCFARQPDAAVVCSAAHDYEVTSTIVLADQPTVPPIDDGAGWSALVGDRCLTAARSYLGRPLPSDLVSWQLPIPPESWAVGRRTIQCTIEHAGPTPLDGPLQGVPA
jgi:hypothetical protein